MRYLFADCTLDTDRRELYRGSEPVSVEPQVFDLLVHLILNRGRVVSKDDLLASIWHGRIVSESALNTRISAARAAIGDNGEGQRLIKTLPRKGIRFVGEVREERALGDPAQGLAHQKKRHIFGLAVEPSSDGLGLVTARWPNEIWTAGGVTRFAATFFRRDRLRVWSIVAVALLCIWLTYVIGQSFRAQAPTVRDGEITLLAQQHTPIGTFKDCEVCPEMVPLRAGEFVMGSPTNDDDHLLTEGPPRRVVLAKPFAIGRFEITVDEFSAFVTATGTTVGNSNSPCRVSVDSSLRWTGAPEASFRRPGIDVTGNHPAGCVSWHDAQAYVAWLRRRTGRPYRLPTEAEWEYAARAGTTTRFSFGDDERMLCDYARFADLASRYIWRDACRSSITTEGPIQVGALKANAWGIFDMLGNVGEWVEDCWTPNWAEIPTDGSAHTRAGNCEMGVVRGGSWISNSRRLRTAYRYKMRTPLQAQVVGFRVALTLVPQ